VITTERVQSLRNNLSSPLVIHLSDKIDLRELRLYDFSFFSSLLEGNTAIRELRADYLPPNIDHDVSVRDEADNKVRVPLYAHIVAELLSKPTKIRLLDLSNNFVGPQGLESLCKALETQSGLTSLQTLGLSHTLMGPSGCVALSKMLLKYEHLTSLDIGTNDIGAEGSDALAASLASPGCSLKILDLSHCFSSARYAEKVILALKDNTKLEQLSIRGSFATAAVGRALSVALSSPTSALHWLDISSLPMYGCNNAVEGLKDGLIQTRSLRTLVMQQCSLINQSAEALSEAISLNSSLENLDLGGSAMRYGNMYYSNNMSSQGYTMLFRAVTANPKIKNFSFSTNEKIMAGAPLPDAANNHRALADLVSHRRTLQTLDIRGLTLKSAVTETSFYTALSENRSLTSLTLCNADLPGGAAKLLAAFLSRNTTLKRLDISYNKQLGWLFVNEYIALLRASAGESPLIEELDVSFCEFDPITIEEFAKALEARNKNLRWLNLGGNEIRNKGALAFASLLVKQSRSCRLQYLDFSKGWIGSAGLTALMNACNATNSVFEVKLQGNLSGALLNPPESVANFTEELSRPRRCSYAYASYADEGVKG
jgi:Ran GTPase-activating protein (RanGAP) involved in mRNA processing and transport